MPQPAAPLRASFKKKEDGGGGGVWGVGGGGGVGGGVFILLRVDNVWVPTSIEWMIDCLFDEVCSGTKTILLHSGDVFFKFRR